MPDAQLPTSITSTDENITPIAREEPMFFGDQVVLTIHLSAAESRPLTLIGGNPIPATTIESLITGSAWNALQADQQMRFLVGIAQMFGTGAGCIITQPIDRINWRPLIDAGYIELDEYDTYVLRLTDMGSILFYSVLSKYIPVEEQP